jgi:hypothetical protein
MTRQLLVNEIIVILNKRDQRIKELRKNKDISDPKVQKEIAQTLVKENLPVNLYLGEDAYLITGEGLKKGKKITVDDVKRLYQLGFQMLWLQDKHESEDDLKENVNYYAKSEMQSLLGKCMHVIKEEDGKKSATSIKILDGEDLLHQTIEPLQYDGAKFLYYQVFGEQNKKLLNLKPILKKVLRRQKLATFEIFDNISIGNAVQLRNKKKQNNNGNNKQEVKKILSNFALAYMTNMGWAYSITLNNINNARLEKDPNDTPEKSRRPDPTKRHGYDDDALIDCCASAFLMPWGYMHSTINDLFLKNTISFYDSKGNYTDEENGYLELHEKHTNTIEKHCNVSYHMFAWMKEKPFISPLARPILQYHQRGINGYGYPKRKTVEEKIKGTVETRYEHEVPEHVRLATIVYFFIEKLLPSPLKMPFARDNLVRHMLLNSEFHAAPDNKEDVLGIFEPDTKNKYKKRFDGYLVNEFLKSISIFKIGERVPIYSFMSSSKPFYYGVVEKQNEMPHRPVVIVTKEGKKIKIDLSAKEHEKLYIGELNPCIRFMDVIDKFHEDENELKGISLKDRDGSDKKLSAKEGMMKEKLNDIFEEPKIKTEKVSTDVDVDSLIAGSIPKALKKKQPPK